jgi:hypothetical protein
MSFRCWVRPRNYVRNLRKDEFGRNVTAGQPEKITCLQPNNIRERMLSPVGFVAWLMRRVLDWMIGFIDTLFTQLGTTSNYSAIANLHTLQFTVTHALGFSVFTSRIPAADLQPSHCNFNSHMKSSFHNPIPFLPLFCSRQFRRLDSVRFLCSQAHILAGWRLGTRLDYPLDGLNWTLLHKHSERTTQKTQSLYCREGMFTSLLHSNGSYSIVACEFVVGGMCLPSRCLAINVYSDFAIPAFGRHVTIFLHSKWFKISLCKSCTNLFLNTWPEYAFARLNLWHFAF